MSTSSTATAAARAPQRKRGELRVAALLEAGAAVFAEKGYDAATMTEIAQRARAPIGSLYQFFPSKESLADALLRRYEQCVLASFDEIDRRVAEVSIDVLADSLLDLLVALRSERAAIMALIEARRPHLADYAAAFRHAMCRRIAGILGAKSPELSAAQVSGIATVLLDLMKAAVRVSLDEGLRSPAMAEMHRMARLYLADRLRQGAPGDSGPQADLTRTAPEP